MCGVCGVCGVWGCGGGAVREGLSATLPLAIVESEPLLFFLTHVTGGRVHSSIVWSVHGTQRLPSNQVPGCLHVRAVVAHHSPPERPGEQAPPPRRHIPLYRLLSTMCRPAVERDVD